VKSTQAPTGVRDFDFLVGTWDVVNRRLARPLAGCTDWHEFPATAECRLILDGHGNVDEFKAPEQGIFGMTLRLFDPEREAWSLYWANSRGGILQPPVVGRFDGDRGEFYGNDTYEGRPIRVVYVWSQITPTSARWEQAFSTDSEKIWEINWIMELTRAG
jgi:hypothetical protein